VPFIPRGVGKPRVISRVSGATALVVSRGPGNVRSMGPGRVKVPSGPAGGGVLSGCAGRVKVPLIHLTRVTAF
jgi:hypothetical protein